MDVWELEQHGRKHHNWGAKFFKGIVERNDGDVRLVSLMLEHEADHWGSNLRKGSTPHDHRTLGYTKQVVVQEASEPILVEKEMWPERGRRL